MRVELEHGQWATFRDDLEEISNRDRRPIMAIYEDPNQPEGWPRAIKANHQLLKWLITGWSLTDAAAAPRERRGAGGDPRPGLRPAHQGRRRHGRADLRRREAGRPGPKSPWWQLQRVRLRARGDATLIDPRSLPPHFRTYQLCRTFGWTVAEAEAAPAPLCDWLLAIDEAVGQGLAERQQHTQPQRRR